MNRSPLGATSNPATTSDPRRRWPSHWSPARRPETGSYFDVGTAPCNGNDCTHGWVVHDICEVTTGSGRQAVPEIYYGRPIDQSAQWAEIAPQCGIKSFPGVSSSPLGDYTPAQSWQLLRRASGRPVGNALLVFPR